MLDSNVKTRNGILDIKTAHIILESAFYQQTSLRLTKVELLTQQSGGHNSMTP